MKIIKNLVNYFLFIVLSPNNYAKRIGVEIGENSYISTKDFSSEPYLIKIGDNVRIAKKVSFFTHGGIWSLRHIYNDHDLDYFGKIKIGDNTYIGQSAMILPGVNIGENSIVAAGSIVTRSFPPGSVIAGNPAKIVNNIDDFYSKITNYRIVIPADKKKKDFLISLADSRFIQKPVSNQ